MNLARGFRRIAWVAVALVTPPIAMVAYDASEHTVHYEARQLLGSFPRLDDTLRQVEVVKDVGIVYVPSHLTKEQVEARMKAITIPPRAAEAEPVIAENDKGEQVWWDGSKWVPVKPLALGSRKRAPIHEFADAVRADKAYADVDDDVLLTKRFLTDHPEYRSRVAFAEYEVEDKKEKRPLWAIGVTTLVVVIVAAAAQGSISLIAWIGRGFRDH